MTNRDKLNGLSNEDFANIVEFVDCFKRGYKCPGMNVPDNGCCCNCTEYFIKWLEQETEDELVVNDTQGSN